MPVRILVVVALVAVWAVGGSVALAFAHCANMAAPCVAPCGTAATIEEAPSASILGLPMSLGPQAGPRLSVLALRGLDPVPRTLRLLA